MTLFIVVRNATLNIFIVDPSHGLQTIMKIMKTKMIKNSSKVVNK